MPPSSGEPGLGQGDAEEGPPAAHAERAGALLQGRVGAAQHRRDRQVDERVVGEGDDPDRTPEALHGGGDRDPAVAGDEGGDGYRQCRQHRPGAAAGKVGALDEPGDARRRAPCRRPCRARPASPCWRAGCRRRGGRAAAGLPPSRSRVSGRRGSRPAPGRARATAAETASRATGMRPRPCRAQRRGAGLAAPRRPDAPAASIPRAGPPAASVPAGRCRRRGRPARPSAVRGCRTASVPAAAARRRSAGTPSRRCG